MADSFQLLDEVVEGALPIINDLSYATAAARIAGSGVPLEARHVGKIALQEDKNSYWRLVQLTPCIKWARMSGVDETETDIEWTVDGVNGNDATGNGAPAYPFATIGYAITQVPHKVGHGVRLLVLHAGTPGVTTYTDTDVEINFEIDTGGYFSIVGVGAPIVHETGILVTGRDDYGVSAGHRFVASGESWTVNELQGKWLVPDNGASEGYAVGILKNGTDDVYTRKAFNAAAIGDSFSIISPSITWTLNSSTMTSAEQNIRLSSILWMNLNLDFTGTDYAGGCFSVRGSKQRFYLDFVSIILADSTADDIAFENGSMNSLTWAVKDTDSAGKTLVDINNLGTDVILDVSAGVCIMRETPGLANKTMTSFRNFTLSAAIVTEYLGTRRELNCSFCAVGGISAINGETDLLDTLINGNGTSGIIMKLSKAWILSSVYILSGTNGMSIRMSDVRMTSEAIGCDAVNVTGHAISCEVTSRVEVGDNTAFIGASGAINFTGTIPDTPAAWPLAGLAETDGLGSFVARPG